MERRCIRSDLEAALMHPLLILVLIFDVSDTAPRRNALYPDLWQINESLKEPVRSIKKYTAFILVVCN